MENEIRININDLARTIQLLREQACDSISEDAVLSSYIMNQKVIQSILAHHKYAISPYVRGGYKTWVNDPTPLDPAHRKLLSAKTETELYIKLAEWYGLPKDQEISLIDLYQQWEEYRRNIKTDTNTIKRDHQRYERYFASTDFFKKKVAKLKRNDWKEFCCKVITGETRADAAMLSEEEKRMTRKEWGNTRCILNGMLELAMDKEIIQVNPLLGMKYENNLFKTLPQKSADKRVFNEIEQRKLVKWCCAKFEESGDAAYLYPPFALLTGLRIGECSALTWDSLTSEETLLISKEEKKDRTTSIESVVNHTKTHNNRTIYLNEEARTILEKIRKSGIHPIWIFARDGERLRNRQLNYVLERYAINEGIDIKASHTLRRTFGSNFYKAGANSKQCSNMLGNSVEVFERCYLYDTDTKDSVMNLLEKVSVSGLS